MTKRCNALGLAALLIITSGCGSIEVPRQVNEAGWLLVETAHIELRTDLEPGQAIRRAQQLEQYWQVLALMYGAVAPGRPPPSGRMPAIHFARCRDLAQFQQRRPGHGFVLRARAWMSQAIAVTCEQHADPVLIHELAHIFNAHHVPNMPVWLNEGLATYYESLMLRNGKAVIGRFPGWLSGGCNTSLPPSLAEIRRMSYEEFHEARDVRCRYFSAWKLVHLLSGTPEDLKRFHRYLAGLRRGSTSEQAWMEAFGDLPAGPLSETFDRYARYRMLGGWSAPYEWREPPRPRLRPLRPTEAHVLWLNMLVHRGDSTLVEQELDRMADAAPDSPEVLYWRAVLLGTDGAIPLLRHYLAQRPDDERARLVLVLLQTGEATPSSYLGFGRPPPAGLVLVEQDVRHLITLARDPSSLNQIGWYFAMRQEPIKGLPFAVRSVSKAPGCGNCWDTLALLFFQAGQIVNALGAQQRAVNLLAEDASPDVLARLRRYRSAAAAIGTAPPHGGRGAGASSPPRPRR